MIDIGVNLTNSRFDEDRTEVISRALNAGVKAMIITGTNLPCSEKAIELVNHYSPIFPQSLYCTAGIHPHDAATFTDDTAVQLEQLSTENPNTVVAVGETGLDFNRNFSPQAAQISAFERQIELAIKLQLPLFLHERDAFQTQYDILKSYGRELPAAVIHCFTGERNSLEGYLELGLCIGITGWICDERRGMELQTLAPDIPLNRLMLETDAPYLTPRTLKPKPKNNRNEPAYLPAVVDKLAQCCDKTVEEITRATTETAKAFFVLDARC